MVDQVLLAILKFIHETFSGTSGDRLLNLRLRLLVLTVAFTGLASIAAALSDKTLNRQLLKLDPATRLEQTCDTEIMLKINRDDNKLSVDKVIAYSFGDPVIGEDFIKAPGAVFRSRGAWYRLSYTCRTGPKHLHARMLEYDIGERIPRTQWPGHYLYD